MFFVSLRFISYLLLSALSVPFAYAVAAPCSAYLSNEALDSLNAAQKDGGYHVHLFHGDVAGKQRLVVLLGETHVKNKKDSILGKNVLRHFSNVGVEGAQIGMGWSKKVLKTSLRAMYKIAPLLTLGIRRYKSTIAEAYSLDSATPSPFQKLVQLETGHISNRAETIFSVAFPAAFFGVLSVAAIDLSLHPGHALIAVSSLASGLVADLVNKKLTRLEEKADIQWIRVKPTNRDRTMVRNIVKTFEENPEVESLLVIAGRAHVPGMGSLLIENHRFESLKIPRQTR